MASGARFAAIVGTGAAWPQEAVSNAELIARYGLRTTDDWIQEVFGVVERRLAAAGEFASNLAIEATSRALSDAGVASSDVEFIILNTGTPDYHVAPNTVGLVQDEIGASRAFGLELSMTCAGYIYGLTLATSLIESDRCRLGLVVGTETMSRIVDYSDRTSAAIFGDGAGAVVVGASAEPGVLGSHLGSSGDREETVIVRAGGTRNPATAQTVERGEHKLRINGRRVLEFAVPALAASARGALQASRLTVDEIDWLIPHQASERVVNRAAAQLGIPQDRVVTILKSFGNTAGASIPMALHWGRATGLFKRSHNLLLTGVGAGLCWGGLVVRWTR